MDTKDLITNIMKWKNEYKNIYSVKILDEIFVFRPLKRNEFKEIIEDKSISDEIREEMVCEISTLYPDDFDFTNCLAGIPSILAENIMAESYMMIDGRAITKLRELRTDMQTYENQMSCIIVEAFPSLILDEVESWDMHKTLYYLSRAEWVLSQMRGLPFVSPEGDSYEETEQYYEDRPQEQNKNTKKEEFHYEEDGFTKDINDFDKTKAKNMVNIPDRKNKKASNKELDELKKNIPEINWDNDSLMNGEFNFDVDEKLTFSAEDAKF